MENRRISAGIALWTPESSEKERSEAVASANEMGDALEKLAAFFGEEMKADALVEYTMAQFRKRDAQSDDLDDIKAQFPDHPCQAEAITGVTVLDAIQDIQAEMKKQKSDSAKMLGMATDLNLKLQNSHDMFRDEFLRIAACPGVSDEIKGLCERAASDIQSRICLIGQREKCADELHDAHTRLEASEKWCAAMRGALERIASEEKTYLGHGDFDTGPVLSANEACFEARATLSTDAGKDYIHKDEAEIATQKAIGEIFSTPFEVVDEDGTLICMVYHKCDKGDEAEGIMPADWFEGKPSENYVKRDKVRRLEDAVIATAELPTSTDLAGGFFDFEGVHNMLVNTAKEVLVAWKEGA